MEHREEGIFRGEIYYVYSSGGGVGSEQSAGRPAVVVSNDKAKQHALGEHNKKMISGLRELKDTLLSGKELQNG